MKYLLPIFLTLAFSFNGFAGDNVKVNFCNHTATKLTINDVVNCNQLTTGNPNWSIKSATLSFDINGNNTNWNLTSSAITPQVQQSIQTNQPATIVIKNIVLVDSNLLQSLLRTLYWWTRTTILENLNL
jgi:hypothetical protein